MITTTDVANILYRDCGIFGIKRIPFGKKVTGPLKGERITFHAKSRRPETYWKKGFVEVNFCIPDLNGEADTIRLNEVEHMVEAAMEGTDRFNGTAYDYGIDSIGIEEDKPLNCHYINCRILFKTLNV